MSQVYLDWAATALYDEEILHSSLERALNSQGNPSAQHDMGSHSRAALNDCRFRCARVLSCTKEQIYFTSGGTESNNLIVLSQLLSRTQGRIIISSLEHPALLEPAQILKKGGADLKILKPDSTGIIQPESLRRALTRDTRLVAIMAVHNETGVIQPLEELVAVVREFQKKEESRPIHFHSDTVQAPGKISLDMKKLDLDSASFSAHKIRGPKGVGLLYLKKPLPVLYRGGGQEGGIRPGTESIQNAEAMALSLEKWGNPAETSSKALETYAKTRDELAKLKGIVFNPPARITHPDLFVPQIINFSLPPLPGEVLQRILNERGFCISTGSACSSNKKSHTEGLTTMGVSDKLAHCSVRISLGPTTKFEEVERVLEEIRKIINEFVF